MAWSCALYSTVYAQQEETEDNSGPLEVETHGHPVILTVMGIQVQIPYPECVSLVNRALRENHPVPVNNEECREVMMEALEIQRTAPPIEAERAHPIPRAEGRTRFLEDEGATSEPTPPASEEPSRAAGPAGNSPFAQKGP
jgi:hypothetical protein